VSPSTFTLDVDGTRLWTQTAAGAIASYAWDTVTAANGARALTLTITDAAGRTAAATLSLTVSNLPTLAAAFTAPALGSTVSGIATVGMASSGAVGSSTFALAVDGALVSSQTAGATASYAWNTLTVPSGLRVLTLTVTDAAGRTAATTRTVTVSNAGFTVSFVSPAAGAAVSGLYSVGMSTTAKPGQDKTFTLAVNGNVVMVQTTKNTTMWYTWDTRTVAGGLHAVTVTVTAKGATAARTVLVTVTNP
jgi:hypothetical protein